MAGADGPMTNPHRTGCIKCGKAIDPARIVALPPDIASRAFRAFVALLAWKRTKDCGAVGEQEIEKAKRADAASGHASRYHDQHLAAAVAEAAADSMRAAIAASDRDCEAAMLALGVALDAAVAPEFSHNDLGYMGALLEGGTADFWRASRMLRERKRRPSKQARAAIDRERAEEIGDISIALHESAERCTECTARYTREVQRAADYLRRKYGPTGQPPGYIGRPCTVCGAVIPAARLEGIPDAVTCSRECAREFRRAAAQRASKGECAMLETNGGRTAFRCPTCGSDTFQLVHDTNARMLQAQLAMASPPSMLRCEDCGDEWTAVDVRDYLHKRKR